MKRITVLLVTLLFVALLLCPLIGTANAEEAPAETSAVVTEPVTVLPDDVATQPPDTLGYTWVYLGTIVGATAAVLLVVQYTKTGLDKLVAIPTRLYAYAWALIIMTLANAFTTGLSINSIPLIAINAFVVATAAMGSYELTYAKKTTT